MNYLLYGMEDFLINLEIKKIIKKENIDDFSITRYDLNLDSIKKIVEDSQTMSLFEDKKIVIVNNCNYFNRVKNNEEDVNLLLNYLTNSNENTILIIVSHNNTIDNTKKITKKIKEVGKVLEFNKININSIVKKLFDNYKISDENINLLISRVGSDIGVLEQEVNKIQIYKDTDLEITKQDILECSQVNVDLDIFKFIDCIISKQKDTALTMYYALLKSNEQPVKIIAILANKFRLMYQATLLSKKGMNKNEIASLIGAHPYSVQLAISSGMRYPSKLLLHFLKSLADLDENIKTGKINAELGLELFILKL